MRYTQAFIPTAKESPAEAQITSHQLMLRAGMIRQVAAGIYTWLPLGLKVLRNIENIIRTELDKAGLLELLMATLQPASLWQQSGRYDSYGKEMLRIKDRHDRDLLYGPTNEEVITDLFQQSLKSYRDVPQCWYQIQWKFRDEIRPRFGVMRGREFLMMDAYSFDLDYEGARATYEKIFLTYLKIFQKMGLKAIPVKADSGAIGGDLSHEFHVLADTGESGLFYDAAYDDLDVTTLTLDALQNIYAQTDDLHKPDACPVAADRLKERRGIEVGHIFYFADKYSTPLNALLTHKDGRKHPAHMGSYGIGV